MKRNKTLYLVSAITFDIAAVCAFMTYFSGNEGSNTWLIMGMAFATLSFPMYLMFLRENKK